ncbi:MAG: methanethiol S-methyltransferase [Myxococcota bacterium]
MNRLGRHAALAYGVACYSIFFVTFLYLIGWTTNLVVPTSVDSGTAGNVAVALIVNAALVAIFGLQHSVMARPGFKAAITRVIPQPLERPTYVLASSAAFVLMFAAWRPIPTALWQTEGVLATVLQAGAFAGFGMVLVTTFLIDHFDLFGLRQVWLAWRGKPYTEKRFVTPGPYRYIRHPLYVGWIIAFWATPTLTVGHALVAVGMTAYILVAIRYEERDLLAMLGEPYRRWRAATPMFFPNVRTRPAAPARTAEAS